MAGDYSRYGFVPARRVSAVLMQQGRVTLDSDQNEQATVVDRRIRNLARDVWGPAWVPALTTPDAFRLTAIAGPDLAIGVGRLYAHGLAPEVLPGESWTWKKQPFLPVPPDPPPGPALAYLDVFEREITWVEDPGLLEKALHGVDTTTRRQVAWQVKLLSAQDARCGTDLDAVFPPSNGRLTTDATGTPASDDPCILPPTGGYRGLENRFYRVQIHVPGPPGTAKFKWSRENASIVSPVEAIAGSGTESELQVTRIGRDTTLRFKAGDWVEITDDRRELLDQAGDMAQIESIDEATRTLTLDRVVPASGAEPFGTTPDEHKARHTRLIRWDQNAKLGNALDGDGLMTTGPLPIALEDGVQVGFTAEPGTGGAMRIGDHWSFAARTVDGSVEKLAAAPPDGVRHVYVPLAEVTAGPGGFVVAKDCRNPVPTTGGGGGEQRPSCECCTICVGREGDVGDLAAALAALPGLAPDPATAVRICLLPGDHPIPNGLAVNRPNTRIVGCFPRARLIVEGQGLLFEADATGLEEVVVVGEARGGAIGFRDVRDGFVRSCWFQGERGGNPGIASRGVRDLVIEDNRMEGAGIALLGDTDGVRIARNRVERTQPTPIVIADDTGKPSLDVTICDNRLVDSLGCGIEVAGPAQRLRILGNRIEMCRGEKPSFSGTAGGIVILHDVEDLVVRDNRIEGNASDARGDSAGIFVARGAAIEIARNRIAGNGILQVEGQPMTGGILVNELRAHLDPDTAAKHRFDPALVVEGNIVIAERGHALFVLGEGDMRVQHNTLLTRFGTARGAGPDDLGPRDLASIAVIAAPRIAELARKLIETAAQGPLSPRSLSTLMREAPFARPGRILVQDNQLALEAQLIGERQQPTLSAVAVYGFRDVDLSHNQLELDRSDALFCTNALIAAQSTRQDANRLTEPAEGALASLVSVGLALNTCAENQGSHCILPSGLAQVIDRDNLVEFPSELCPRG